jgi:hypothetical protein
LFSFNSREILLLIGGFILEEIPLWLDGSMIQQKGINTIILQDSLWDKEAVATNNFMQQDHPWKYQGLLLKMSFPSAMQVILNLNGWSKLSLECLLLSGNYLMGTRRFVVSDSGKVFMYKAISTW